VRPHHGDPAIRSYYPAFRQKSRAGAKTRLSAGPEIFEQSETGHGANAGQPRPGYTGDPADNPLSILGGIN